VLCGKHWAIGAALRRRRHLRRGARFSVYKPSAAPARWTSGTTYYLWAGRQSPGFNAWGYEFTGTAGVQYFSDQVYAPGAAHVCVEE
jgi:hypothetical protein